MVVDARRIWMVKAGNIFYRLYNFGFEGIVSNMRFDLKLKMQIRFYFLNIVPYSMSILGRALCLIAFKVLYLKVWFQTRALFQNCKSNSVFISE